MADAPEFDFNAILQASPVVLGMSENSPQGVFSRLFDALVAAGSLPAIRTVLRLKPAEVLHGGK